MEIQTANKHKESVVALLKAEKLLVDDLPENLYNFVIALDGNEVIGVAGLEVYGDCGLLRSVAVTSGYRNKGIAAKLLSQIEQMASANGLKTIYLFTETAPNYFQLKGYSRIAREEAPKSLHASSEFSYACPQSAIVMKKTLE